MAETELIDKDNDLLHSTIANVKPMDRTGGQAESTDMQDKFIDRIVQHFYRRLKLLFAMRAEFGAIVSYVKKFYISVQNRSAQSVWWRLFHSPNFSERSNILALTRLLFSLPVSSAKSRTRIFTQVDLLKNTEDQIFPL